MVNTVSEAIEIIGKEIYGEKFSIEPPKTKQLYKKLFGIISGKKPKGAFITGSIGVGKSAAMRVMQKLLKDTENKFLWVSGYELKDLAEQITAGEIKAMYGYQLKCDLYIDDIGFSVDVKRYGNTVNIISEIIMERYELFISSHYKTHLSSNIVASLKEDKPNTPTIEKVYGLRVLDRMMEMCEMIVWNGESLRKN